jgi:hypothetical protein
VWGEFISIPKGVIGMATTCEDKSRAVPRSHSEWSVVIGSRRMARSAGIQLAASATVVKYQGDASEGGQIGRRHAVEQTGHEVRDDERTGHTLSLAN